MLHERKRWYDRLVATGKLSVTVRDKWAGFEVQSVLDHEVVVLE